MRHADQQTNEPIFTIKDLCAQWGLGYETVRKLVRDEPGVIHLSTGTGKRTAHRVPLAVANRIYARLTRVAR